MVAGAAATALGVGTIFEMVVGAAAETSAGSATSGDAATLVKVGGEIEMVASLGTEEGTIESVHATAVGPVVRGTIKSMGATIEAVSANAVEVVARVATASCFDSFFYTDLYFSVAFSFYWIHYHCKILHTHLCWIQMVQMLWLEEVHEEDNAISLMAIYLPDTFMAASAHLASSSVHQLELDVY